MKIRQDSPATITIIFPNPEGAVGWFQKAQEAGLLQEEAGVYQAISTDGASVPSSNEFIVRRAGDPTRPGGQLRITSTNSVEVQD